jgi:hypothetical protein
MTPDAAPALYEIAASDHPYSVRALRGYLRIARQLNMEADQRMAMCAEALKIAKRPEERRLVLEVLSRAPSSRGIEMASGLLEDKELRPHAAEAIVVIAEKIKETDAAAASSAAKRAIAAGLNDELSQRAQALVDRN